jgi:hypothetical protein
MTTATDIIYGALRQCSSVTPGEPIQGDEAGNALNVLNDMIASWSAESFMPPFKTKTTFSLTQGQESYTIGTSGSPNFNQVRPDAIAGVYFTDNSNPQSPIDYAGDVAMTQDQYNSIALKSIAGIPRWLYYDPQFPNGVIYIYQTAGNPNFTMTCELLLPVAQFTTLTSVLSMPPEYTHAMKMLLADLLAFEYGYELTQRQITEIERCRSWIMAKNAKREAAVFDPMFRRRGTYTILSGGPSY